MYIYIYHICVNFITTSLLPNPGNHWFYLPRYGGWTQYNKSTWEHGHSYFDNQICFDYLIGGLNIGQTTNLGFLCHETL